MSSRPRRPVEVTGAHRGQLDGHVTVLDDVQIIVTQAFGPRGDNLVGVSEVTFDGYPAVTVEVEADGRRGQVHLSPIHGDDRKAGFLDIPNGTVCALFCPVSGAPLDVVEAIPGIDGASYCALYLTPKLSKGDMVLLSNVWGHYHSRIIDGFELISAWADREE